MSLREFSGQFNIQGKLPPEDLERHVKSIPPKDLMASLLSVEGETTLNPIGKDVFEGDYKKVEGTYQDGGASLPFIIEAWATATDCQKDGGYHSVDV